ncbi:hypothetical protein OSTOST_21709 [Ostertagia ostertagi]
MGAEPMSREQAISISLHTLHSMLLCCCWPVHKCVTVLSCFDTLIVAIFTYKSLNLLAHTIYEPLLRKNWDDHEKARRNLTQTLCRPFRAGALDIRVYSSLQLIML